MTNKNTHPQPNPGDLGVDWTAVIAQREAEKNVDQALDEVLHRGNEAIRADIDAFAADTTAEDVEYNKATEDMDRADAELDKEVQARLELERKLKNGKIAKVAPFVGKTAVLFYRGVVAVGDRTGLSDMSAPLKAREDALDRREQIKEARRERNANLFDN